MSLLDPLGGVINGMALPPAATQENVRYYPRMFLEGLRKTTETSMIVHVSGDNRTENLPNKRQKRRVVSLCLMKYQTMKT
jgi:hypothetical protein